MNEILTQVWDERVTRLRLGIELTDALGRPGPAIGLGVFSENVPRPHPVPKSAATPFWRCRRRHRAARGEAESLGPVLDQLHRA